MKAAQRDPFNFDQVAGTEPFIKASFQRRGNETTGTDLMQSAGRYPGSWTLPVCNASAWGHAWNSPYDKDPIIRKSVYTHPPCMCGK